MSGGWGWDADALPIGTQGGPGGVGRRDRRRAAERGWGAAAHPNAGRGGGFAAGGCPPPLPRPAHKGARGPRFLLAPLPSRPKASGPRRAHCRRGGVSGSPVPSGLVRPCCPQAPSRPGGSVKTRPWPPGRPGLAASGRTGKGRGPSGGGGGRRDSS